MNISFNKVILEISGHSSTLLQMGFNPQASWSILCVLCGAVFSLLVLTVFSFCSFSVQVLCCKTSEWLWSFPFAVVLCCDSQTCNRTLCHYTGNYHLNNGFGEDYRKAGSNWLWQTQYIHSLSPISFFFLDRWRGALPSVLCA